MNRYPLLPYAIIGLLAVFVMVIVSYIGLNQREARENPENNALDIADVDAIYKNTCAVCHGDDLEGASAPPLVDVGGRMSKEEIKTMIIEGSEDQSMPGGLVNNEQAELIAEWLAEQQ